MTRAKTKTKTTALILSMTLLGAGLAFGGESAPAEPPAGAGKALFEAKCSICHPLSRPLGEHQDRAEWTKDVTRMQKVNGCPITDEEAKAIIEYLVKIRGPASAREKK